MNLALHFDKSGWDRCSDCSYISCERNGFRGGCNDLALLCVDGDGAWFGRECDRRRCKMELIGKLQGRA